MPKTFEQELRERGGFETKVRTRMSILPPRLKVSGPRTGGHLTAAARAAGDCWYFAATPLFKFVLSKIEARFSALPEEPKYLKRKVALINEARVILNEHRNQIFEAVLPLYDVSERIGSERLTDGDALSAADAHAHDFFVRNVFYMLAQTYVAHLPEFVAADEVTSSESTFNRLAALQTEKLQQELRNFEFGFRRIAAPAR